MAQKPLYLDEFKEELFREFPDVRREYERLGPRFDAIAALVAARKARGMSQRDLARRMDVSQSVVARLESGVNSPRIDTLAAAAEALGCRLEVRFVPEADAARRVAEEPGDYRAV